MNRYNIYLLLRVAKLPAATRFPRNLPPASGHKSLSGIKLDRFTKTIFIPSCLLLLQTCYLNHEANSEIPTGLYSPRITNSN